MPRYCATLIDQLLVPIQCCIQLLLFVFCMLLRLTQPLSCYHASSRAIWFMCSLCSKLYVARPLQDWNLVVRLGDHKTEYLSQVERLSEDILAKANSFLISTPTRLKQSARCKMAFCFSVVCTSAYQSKRSGRKVAMPIRPSLRSLVVNENRMKPVDG